MPVALGASLAALVCAVLLPLLPVAVNQPVVSWPADPSSPQSTALQLTTQRPVALDVRAGCAAARAAGASADGLLLATMPPQSGETRQSALVATVRGDQLAMVSRGVPLYLGPLPAGDCTIAVTGDQTGMALALDGQVVGRAPPQLLPDVDALVTSVPATAPGTTAGLDVRLTLDDQFATSPTPLKGAVTVLLVLAVLVALGALVARDRAAGAVLSGGARVRPRPRVVDAVVPLVLAVWSVIAPMTDDDGYYSAMAANVPFSGYVANYYQLYNQGFTPFTWMYYALSAWQQLVGFAPVVLRLPSLALGLVCWVLLRAFVARALPAGSGRGRAVALHAALAIGFLAWWLPFDPGVRAEPVVATAVVASLLALVVGLERDRWALFGLAVAVASFGATAAPTGFVALAPLLACLPAVWRRLRADTSVPGALGRLVAVAGPGALVGLLGFVDGSFRDFVRGQQIFLGMQSQESWYSEITRWIFLLTDGGGPMGSYAKRVPVLLGLLALVCLGLLAAHLRGRGRPMPPRAALAATTLLLGFALLWLTPSKWTHHFGTLAGVGAVVLALAMVGTPVLLRDLARGGDGDPDRPVVRTPVLVGAGLLLAVLAALGWHGRNAWPYSWLLGLPDPGERPSVGFVSFDQPLWWILGGLVLAAAVVAVTRRRAPAWRPVAGVVAVALTAAAVLLVTTTYLVGGFALATAGTMDTWSPWADAVRDPLGHDCGAVAAMQVLDPASATPMTPLPALPSPAPGGSSGFVDGGWFPTSPPPATASDVARGSFTPPPPGPSSAAGNDGTVGAYATPWYAIPDRPDGAMTTSISGRTGDGNTVRVEYARAEGDRVVPVAARDLGLDPGDEAVDSPVWRGVLLEEGNGPPPGADVMRLVAVDASTAPGGWVAFTDPTVQRWSPLADHLVPGEASAVGWQYAFLFPCQRKPVQADGVNEPSTVALVWGDQELAYRGDGIWQIRRGGLFAQSLRDSEVVGLVTRLREAPDADAGMVYRLTPYVPSRPGAYRLERESVVVAGWSPAPNTTMSVPIEGASD